MIINFNFSLILSIVKLLHCCRWSMYYSRGWQTLWLLIYKKQRLLSLLFLHCNFFYHFLLFHVSKSVKRDRQMLEDFYWSVNRRLICFSLYPPVDKFYSTLVISYVGFENVLLFLCLCLSFVDIKKVPKEKYSPFCIDVIRRFRTQAMVCHWPTLLFSTFSGVSASFR